MARLLGSLCVFLLVATGRGAEPFAFRGYYTTFMRMPAMGLPEWKEQIDCMKEDRSNTLLLWMGGGFRSRKFPITWKYNSDHKNVREDFGRELIDYAHGQGIRVLLAFTPFGYDGVNQFPIEHPELKAKKADGSPVDAFGIHCWGWSLCPSQVESQKFMLDYAREMAFEFYPNADGLMIESSDYNVCRCGECGPKYYEREFRFVRQISDEVWSRNPNATILVYPHYFTGKKVNAGTAIEGQAAAQTFDPRWTLSFNPHSAHIDPELLAKARSTIFWTEAPSLGTPWAVRDGAKLAFSKHLTGYVPSLEPFSYVMPREEFGTKMVGKRIKPLGFDWLPDGKMPLRELPARLQRFAYREFCRNPELSDADFRKLVGKEFFNDESASARIDDLFFLQESVNRDRRWSSSSPLVEPELFDDRSKTEKWPPERVESYRKARVRMVEIARRYEPAQSTAEKEMQQIAEFIVKRWR